MRGHQDLTGACAGRFSSGSASRMRAGAFIDAIVGLCCLLPGRGRKAVAAGQADDQPGPGEDLGRPDPC